MDDSIAKQIRLTYNAVDYKALLKKAVLLLDESDVSYLSIYFKPDELKVLDALLEEVYNERE
jgi:hypothetical protein